jgi:hypothetical protein
MVAEHRFLKWLLPAAGFEEVKSGTKRWLAECPCGHKRDLWDSGGVRYLAAGKPRQLATCPACGKATWHRIRRKSDTERAEIP